TVQSCLVEGSVEVGIYVDSADAIVASTLVRDTRANDMGQYGDGIVAGCHSGDGPSHVTLAGDRIEESARAGLSNFGSFVALRSTAIECTAFDIEGEEVQGVAFSFDNQGENVCGCPDAQDKCKVVSAGLDPPKPLQPPTQ